MNKCTWKVGELALLTGLTVRALHHYDAVGLVSPSHHSEAGHRLYSEADITRLQQVMSLKQLGLSLEEMKTLLDSRDYYPREIIHLQLERLREQIRVQEQLRAKLEEISHLLDTQQVINNRSIMR